MPRIESAVRYKAKSQPKAGRTSSPTPSKIYEEPRPTDEFTRLQVYLFTLVHFATRGMEHINDFCDVAPWPLVLFVVFVFVISCNIDPTTAALVAALMWWFLVMTEGRLTLRIIVAAALIAEIYQLLEVRSYLLTPLKL